MYHLEGHASTVEQRGFAWHDARVGDKKSAGPLSGVSRKFLRNWSGLWDSNPRSQPWEGRMLPLHQARKRLLCYTAYQMPEQKSRNRCPRVDSNHHALSSTGPQPAAYTIPPRGLGSACLTFATHCIKKYIMPRWFCQSPCGWVLANPCLRLERATCYTVPEKAWWFESTRGHPT